MTPRKPKVHYLAGERGLTSCGLHSDPKRNTIKSTKYKLRISCERCLKLMNKGRK